MTLPAPNLDDRRFQDLVDDAKRMVQQRCPEWTDHNVSDPGVTLIETFAYMVDQLIYRVNRVPDRLYLRFLDLLGVRPFPPTAAATDVTFWLTAPQPAEVTIPKGTSVSTTRTETEEAIVFSVTEDLMIPPVSLVRLASAVGRPLQPRDHTSRFELGTGFEAFGAEPAEGEALYVGLSRPAPSCTVLLRMDCEVRGLGVDPTNPPLVWEVFDGTGWAACRVQKDETGGLNRAGDLILHLPPAQVVSSFGNVSAAWLRCRIHRSSPEQSEYSASPRIRRLTVATIGGTARVTNAELVVNEVIGSSEGVPGQRFELRRHPVVPGQDPEVLEVSTPQGWEQWTKVPSFAGSGPEDRHFVLEAESGVVALGPAVREPGGGLRRYGATPPAGATLRVPSYRTGGGRRGNVAPGALNVLKSSIPFISRVENRTGASGGVDGESIEAVKVRGPLTLRTSDRAVTSEDYEYLVREIAPEIGRVRCVPDPGGSRTVRVLVVPRVAGEDAAGLTRAELDPPTETLRRIQRHLNERRIIGVQVSIEPPGYRGLTVVTRIKCNYRYSPELVKAEATGALYRYLHPVIGGPDGGGWPFGKPVTVGEIHALLDEVPGTDIVDELLLFPADVATQTRAERPVPRLAMEENQLPLSYRHQVFVERK